MNRHESVLPNYGTMSGLSFREHLLRPDPWGALFSYGSWAEHTA
jgi:hypothetical protein